MQKTKKKVTLKDIALETGYSVNCVSRALMDASDISRQTKEKIQEVANRLGYVPNIAAASLKNGNSKIIGILYDNLLNPYYNTILAHVEDILNKKGYAFITFRAGKFDEKIYKYIISRNVEGLLSFLIPSEEVISIQRKRLFPTVIIGRKSKQVSSVYYDDAKGGYLAGKYLIEKGYKNSVYFGEIEDLVISKERSNGFKKAMLEANKKANIQFRPHGSRFTQMVDELLEKNPTVDSIFCFSDFVAYEVINELSVRNRNDIKIIGFDNIQKEIMMPYKLTTVGQDKELVAQDALNLLFEQITSKDKHIVKEIKEDVFLVE